MQGGLPVRVVFFCGDESPFGRAHILPFLEERFSVQAVVVPTAARWQHFRVRLLGDEIDPPQRLQGRASFRSLLGRARAALAPGQRQRNPWSTLDEVFPQYRVRKIC